MLAATLAVASSTDSLARWALRAVVCAFDALGSFAFNLGAGALQRSTLRRKVNRAEHDAVPGEFRRWVWAGGAGAAAGGGG